MDRYVIVSCDEDGIAPGSCYDALLKLSVAVNDNMAIGYDPIGGIGCRPGSQSGAVYFQAMFLSEVLAIRADCEHSWFANNCLHCGQMKPAL